jgi:hypothetical protein
MCRHKQPKYESLRCGDPGPFSCGSTILTMGPQTSSRRKKSKAREGLVLRGPNLEVSHVTSEHTSLARTLPP